MFVHQCIWLMSFNFDVFIEASKIRLRYFLKHSKSIPIHFKRIHKQANNILGKNIAILVCVVNVCVYAPFSNRHNVIIDFGFACFWCWNYAWHKIYSPDTFLPYELYKDAHKRWWYEVKRVIALAYNKLIKFSSLWRQIIWFFTIIAFGSGSGSVLVLCCSMHNICWMQNDAHFTHWCDTMWYETIVMARECGLNGNWTNEGNTGELTKFNRLYYFLVFCCCLWSLNSSVRSSSSISITLMFS